MQTEYKQHLPSFKKHIPYRFIGSEYYSCTMCLQTLRITTHCRKGKNNAIAKSTVANFYKKKAKEKNIQNKKSQLEKYHASTCMRNTGFTLYYYDSIQ